MKKQLKYSFAFLAAVSLSTVVAIAEHASHFLPVASEQRCAKPAWLRIDAFVNVPLVGADIAVYDSEGRRLFAKSGATNQMGVYPAGSRFRGTSG